MTKNDSEKICKSATSYGSYMSKADPTKGIIMGYFDGREPEDTIIEDGVEYERAELTLDFDAMPRYVQDDLTKSAYEAFTSFVKRPDAQTILDATKERLQREGSTLLDHVAN
jgi:hypothetical protein